MLSSLFLAALVVPSTHGLRKMTARNLTTTAECRDWCEADYSGGNNAGRHCPPGDMSQYCGGCAFCGGGACESWCEADYNGGNNAGRHCGSGDMAHLCGGCSFCSGSPSPSPPPSPPSSGPTSDCARRLNNYEKTNAACMVKDNNRAMLVYVPYGSPGWDFPGGVRNSGEYACETAERETCEESSHKVRALYQISYGVFMCEFVQESFCRQSVDEGFLSTRWVSRNEVYSVNYRPGTWGDKPAILYANLD